MSQVLELPLNPYPETFSVTISNVAYNGRTLWNVPLQTWVMSLEDSSNNPIISNIPLIPGVDLLQQFKYLNLGVMLQASVDHDASAVPSYAGLGSTGHLYVVVP